MPSSFDEARFRELMVESKDLQSDAMKGAKTDLDDYVGAALEARHERRNDDRPRPSRSGLGVGGALLGAGALGVAGLALAGPASAADKDVQVLQTAASLENLAVAVYTKALTLPFISGGNAVVKTFAQMTMKQHGEHADAFNAAVTKMGGKKQTQANPTYNAVVQKALPGIKGAGDVVSLAVTLEDIATQTYVKNISDVSTKELRQLFGSVAGVEAQHKATLLAVGALLKAAPDQIKLPPTNLPEAAGSVGFPDAFFPTKKAAAATSGQVK